MLGIGRSALYIQIAEEHQLWMCKLNLNDICYQLWSLVFSGTIFPLSLLEDTLFCFCIMMLFQLKIYCRLSLTLRGFYLPDFIISFERNTNRCVVRIIGNNWLADITTIDGDSIYWKQMSVGVV